MHRRHIGKSDRSQQKTNESNDENEKEEIVHERDCRCERLSLYGRLCERLSFMKYVILVLIIPPILNLAALKRESFVLLPKQGEQIDMGWGQKMFVSCLGEGLPVVILDAPTGGTSDVWYLVQEKLSRVSKVCVYDRAGLGFSDLPFVNDMNQKSKVENRKFVSQVATLEQMTCDLHHLVTNAKPLPRPFIMVGAETGGLITRHYAMTYPEDVSDIVLVNPLVEDLFWRQKEDWNNYWNLNLLPMLQSLQLSAYAGISRIAALTGYLKSDIAGHSIPKDVELRQIYHLCNPSHMSAVFQEHLNLNTSFSQMNEVWQTKPFPKNISVTVVNSEKFEKFPPFLQKAWQQSQLYLRQSLHPTSKHYVFDGSTEELLNHPEIVVSRIQQLIYRWRVNFNIFPTVHTFREQESLSA
ncbi:uncharacterized protein LOC118194179 isoform X1 [Stegodyphus dumicola]|uniref:uncharacterized protein LOC118194179 isoform X1 n=1 Tax=Stegodyphus dumicola TaxID=202533 RepID=UPI0015A940F4|nr:uncharacterized protein LOC118194179 isoform X1 [Stegodyphus dumicola]